MEITHAFICLWRGWYEDDDDEDDSEGGEDCEDCEDSEDGLYLYDEWAESKYS